MSQDEPRLALFIDFENIAIGVRDAHYRRFEIDLLLERLLDKGKLLAKRAYADWSRYAEYKRAFHEAAIELIEVPQKSVGGKNSADIRLVVDAMDMAFQKEHINCFVVASGDSDFSPLVSKLKENNKYVIGMGVKNSTSDLLMESCDEFIFYEDLVRRSQQPLPEIAGVPDKLQECFGLLADAVLALQRENKEILWGSMVKETMKRKRPSFNESYYGFRTFSHLLQDAQRRNIVTLRRDTRSGSYVVEDLGEAAISELKPDAPRASEAARSSEAAPRDGESAHEGEGGEAASSNGRPRRRRGGRGRRGRGGAAAGDEAAAEGSGSEVSEAGSGQAESGYDDASPETSAAAGASEPAAPAAAPGPEEPHGEPLREADRDRSFSLFSWMRRDDAPKSEGGEPK